jgi:hypothetical protein
MAIDPGTTSLNTGGLTEPMKLGGAHIVGTTDINAGGIGGFLGNTKGYDLFTAPEVSDPNYDANKTKLGAAMEGLQRQRAPTMQAAQIGAVGGLPTDNRQNMSQLSSALLSASQGGGPSAAQNQLGLATDANMQNALAMAASAPGHGGNYASALKQAMTQRAGIQQNAALQSGQLRAQEMAGARGQLSQLGSALGQYDIGARGQDIGLATSQAGLNQQAGLANQQTQLAQQQHTNELIKQYTAMGMSQDQAYYQAMMQQKQFNAGLLAQQMAAGQGVGVQNQAQGTQVAGAGLAAAGSVLAAAASDERVKTDISDGSTELGEFLSGIGVHKYRYKDPDKPLRGRGEFVSPMAQELEKTKLGKSMVSEMPDGTKAVDYGKGLGLMLAAMAKHEQQISKLERGGRG